ncbi:MAG: rod shape-determining protein MreC [Patescibacteria group bacterium]
MTKSNSVLLALIVVLVFLIFFAPQIAWQARSYLTSVAIPSTSSGNNAEAVALENVALKAELAKLENIKSQLPEKPYNYIRAIVLSRYPMNFQKEFLVDAGSIDGVTEKHAVVFQGALVGRVSKVFDTTALVETVFDPNFETSVRIGAYATDALFKGGLTPELKLIPLEAKVKQGDVDFAASPDFPYGLPIAAVKEVRVSDDKLFEEAMLEFSYDINSIKSVLIATAR